MMNPTTPTAIEGLAPDLALHIELSKVGVDVMQLLRHYVVSDVESYAVAVPAEGPRWYDVRPMVDPREHAPAFIDMAHHALAVGIALGAITRHHDAEQPWLVRVMTF